MVIQFKIEKFVFNNYYRSQYPNVFFLDLDNVKWYVLDAKQIGARFEVLLWEEDSNTEFTEIFNGDEIFYIEYDNEVAHNDS